MPPVKTRVPPQAPRQLLNSYEVRLMARDLIEGQGIDPKQIFSGTGVSRKLLDTPAQRLSLQQEFALYLSIARNNRDPSLGMRIGSRLNLPNYGVLGSAMMSAATVGDALQLLVEFAPMVSWASHSELKNVQWEDGECSAFTVYPSVSSADLSATILEVESTFASIQVLFNELTTDNVRFEALEMNYPCAGDGMGRYEDLFACPVLFSRSRNRILLSQALLRRPLPNPQPEYSSLYLSLCRQATEALQEDRGLVAAVKSRLRFDGGIVPDMEDLAAQLNVSARSLRRQLSDAGVSFRALLDETRYREARRYLSSTQLTVEAIAIRLNYADARSFRTAFKRWSAMTPADFRATGAQ